MKKVILFLLCFLSFNNVFASSNKFPNGRKRYIGGVWGAFNVAIDQEKDSNERTEAIEVIARDYNRDIEYKELIVGVYNLKKKRFEDDGDKLSKERLIQVGHKLGIE